RDDTARSSTQEFHYPADATLMSITDTQSYVGYANTAFLDVSDYFPSRHAGTAAQQYRTPSRHAQGSVRQSVGDAQGGRQHGSCQCGLVLADAPTWALALTPVLTALL